MSPELEAAYLEASKPFWQGGGAITQKETSMRSWRYFLEVNSACNLRCPSCTKGNKEGYEHQNGIMEWGLMLQCIDKIANENKDAIVFLYGNSEPFLHPKLPEVIQAVKARGLRCEFSTNLNHVHRLDETLAAGPSFIIISLSGFTQEVYVKGHQGGDIEKVKANLKLLGEANRAHKVPISVNYHVYTDNEHELPLMKEYCESVGVGIFTSNARAISMENAIQHCREKDPNPEPYAVQPHRPDWNHLLPPVTQQWKDTMARLKIPPEKAREMYAHLPHHPVCPVGDMFTFIRHDGKTSLCACVADRRITLGDFLETSQDRLSQQRRGHAICQQCLKYRMSYYFHIVDRDKWGDYTI